MNIKKIIIRAAICISVLLLIFIGVLKYRDYMSYKNVIHKEASTIIKLSVDKTAKSIVFNALKNPSYYYDNNTKNKDSIKVKDSLKTGFSLPANIFIYTLKSKPSTTWFSVIKIKDSSDFSQYLSKKYALKQISKNNNYTLYSNNKNTLTVAYNTEKSILIFNPSQANVDDVLLEIFTNKNTLIPNTETLDKLKKQDAHVSIVSPNKIINLMVKNGNLDIHGQLQLSNQFEIPKSLKSVNYSKNNSLQAYLNLIYKGNLGTVTIDTTTIHLDSINYNLNGHYSLFVDGKTQQEDTIVTYDYNDDFEKVPIKTLVNKDVPNINLQLDANASKLFQYLNNSNIVNQKTVNSKIFPLYQLHADTTNQDVLISTQKQANFSKLNTTAKHVFSLQVDFNQVKNQQLFTFFNFNLEQLNTLNISANQEDQNTLSINGKLSSKNKKINLLMQLKN